ncbi:MAG TPA: PaaI family thioesterase [Bryobacteraceae bacterium]
MPFNKLIGVRVLRRHADGVTIECRMRDELQNSAGVLHGGVAATLADAAVGIALASHFGGRRPCTTTDLKINYLSAVSDGKIIARSHLLRVGKRLCVGRVDIADSHGKLIAVAIVTYMLL